MTDSPFNTLRVYRSGTFQNVPLPDWYIEAERIASKERLDWEDAISRVLVTDSIPMTHDTEDGWLAVRFWQGPDEGFIVNIQNPIGNIEMVWIPKATDWMPFVSAHIAPLIAADAQATIADTLWVLKNAAIAFFRHGEGDHVSRQDGISRIDIKNDRRYFSDHVARQKNAQNGNGGAQ
jgi:hypothetical protein